MAYSSGGTIQATDYNTLVGSNSTTAGTINYVWDVGNGVFGYGQGAVAAVSGGSTVTATQWSTMLNALNRCLGHQSGAGAQLGPLNYTAGQTITAFANVITANTTINTNKALYTAQGSTTTGTNFTNSIVTTTGWNFSVDRVVTFASADAARYFFNAGGQLNFKVSVTGGTGSASNNSFTNIVNAMGGFGLRNTTNTGRTGTGLTLNTNNTAFGYRNNVFNAESEIVKVTDTATAYTANYGRLISWTNSSDTTNGANGATCVFRINMVGSDHTWDDSVNCTLNTSVDIVYPETTFLSSSPWGTPTIS
jgi:hypothetical protein